MASQGRNIAPLHEPVYGLGNSIVATAELGSASLISLLALAAPLAALALVVLIFWLAFRLFRGSAQRPHQPNEQ
jgi:DUF1365 family protein